MLVLTRKAGQSVIINGDTVIRILEIRGNQIRIGINASDNVTIVRSELVGPTPDGEPGKVADWNLTARPLRFRKS